MKITNSKMNGWRIRVLILAFVATTPLWGATNLLDLSTGLTDWTTTGSVQVLNSTDEFSIQSTPFSLTPSAGENMFKITPSGIDVNGASAADTALGLNLGSVAGLLNNANGHVTNFAIVQKSFTLDAGTYSFAWAYAAQDYFPFNDGVMFAVAGPGGQTITSLARNGSSADDLSGPSPGTLILGSYGTTSWKTTSFDVVTGGTYLVSFAAYNWNDTAVNPVFYIAAGAGSFTGTEVVTSSIPEPSTYAALAGVLALAAASFYRFRAQRT